MESQAPLYQPSELKRFLQQLGVAPKKGLSQNFLIDGNILKKIVTSAEVCPGDLVLEIGPGPGSLTQTLLTAGAKVVAVEKDATFAAALDRLSADNTLRVFQQDILKFDIEEVFPPLMAEMGQLHGQRTKVIANLPYHLTTPIIAMLVTMRHLFSSLTVMVQEEVARRFIGLPGTSQYSSFTIFLQFYCRVHYCFKVSRNCFYPKPGVDSAVVTLQLREPPSVSDVDKFFYMVRTAFGHRRKMLRSSLKEVYDAEKISQGLISIGKDPLARPETLSLEELLSLFELLQR